MDNNKVFVGSLPPDLIDGDLAAMFIRFGKIVEAIVVTDRYTHKSKCFGYITFLKNKDALKAIAAMDQELMQGKKMLVTFAKRGS